MAKKKLAVVVPMYNVQDFLKEALDSLLKQGLSENEMQIILIDDGSEDNTFQIAQQYVSKYPELFEVYSFKNAGLGAARNRGTRLANAEYITYVDPDDIVVENSYHKGLDILSKTGSEILIGGTKRFNSKKTWNSTIHAKSVTRDKFRTNLRESPELIWDSTSWNKIYNMKFIRKNNFYFPEGMLYEDLPMVTPALAKAASLDVMSDTMYLWRVRDFGRPSITQLSSNDTSAILDRLQANSSVLKSLKEMHVEDAVLDMQAEKFLDFDTLMMFRRDKYELFSPIQKAELFTKLKEYLLQFSNNQILRSNFENQVFFQKVLEIEKQNEFDLLALSFLRNETNYSGKWINNRWILSSDISNFTKIATSADMQVDTKVQCVSFDDQSLNLTGYIYAKYSDMSKPSYVKNPKVSLVNEQGQIIDHQVGTFDFFENKNVTAKFGYNKNHFWKDTADFNYDYSGYQIKIPLNKLAIKTQYLNIQVSFEVDGQTVISKIMKPIQGKAVRPDTKVSAELKTAFDIKYDTTSWVLQVIPTVNIAILTYHDNIYSLDNAYENVYLQQEQTKLFLKKHGERVLFPITVSKRLSNFEKEGRGNWSLMTDNNSNSKPVYFAQSPVYLQHDTLFKILSSKSGYANFEISWYFPKTRMVSIADDVLTVDFNLFGWEKEAIDVNVIADPKLPDIIWHTKRIDRSTYRLILPLQLDGFGDKEWLNFNILLKFADGYETTQTLKWGDSDFDLEGKQISVNHVQWEFRRVSRNHGGFAIKRTADRVYRINEGELERFLEVDYSKWLQEPLLEDTIVWSAYWGRDNKFGGNPRALYEYVTTNYPNLKHIIVVKNVIQSKDEFGKNTQVISFGTKEYWYYLAKSKYFVNDVNFTEMPRKKRENQIDIQTMHGTPLKTLGFDVLDEWKDSTYNSYLKRFRSYDYLVVPSDWVGKYATHAFHIHPKLLKTGYPRNDIFFKHFSDNQLIDMKKQFDLPINKKIILYAPTWREKDLGKATNISRLIDIQKLYQSLPDDIFVVVKYHNFQPLDGIDDKFKDKIAFATPNASIEQLYILSDAVITDYSSVMFDYSLLNKPMIFWAFDYDDYVTNRGINFDLRATAPGPFVQRQEDLVKWINHTENILEQFEERITSFREKFGQYDDGHASQKIANIIWGAK